jgi:(E)-4-hydroxy-3-methylbut-2-enyl-diphosphate synthase
VIIGGGFPVSVQTMWKKPLLSTQNELIGKIDHLKLIGCQILRFAVPKMETAEVLGLLAQRTSMPLVADIHFDYKIALRCMDFPIAKVRINPGNIGADWKVQEIIQKAGDKGIPLRIGVNSGSLPEHLEKEKDKSLALLKAAEEEMNLLEKYGFKNAVFSLKAPDIQTTVRSNRLFALKYPYPLHIGITEAGPLIQGVVKSTIALMELLKEGIGDTVRVSLSDSPENEVLTALNILKYTGLEVDAIEIISCPTCGRVLFDVQNFIIQVNDFLRGVKKNISVAIMGCPVNGPGEAKHADIGITGTDKYAVIFKKGKIIKRVDIHEALSAFKEAVIDVVGKKD